MMDIETSELPINYQQNINEMVETFMHVIINAADKFIGYQNTNPRVP
jgi:hypothetical protein